MGTGFSKKKKQAKQLQKQFEEMQEKMKDTEVTGQAGNGLVQVTLTGDQDMKSIKIKEECVDPEDVEALEDLICAAYQNAQKKLKEESPMSSLDGLGGLGQGGLPFPGMGGDSLPF